jgi:hypothetical protein
LRGNDVGMLYGRVDLQTMGLLHCNREDTNGGARSVFRCEILAKNFADGQGRSRKMAILMGNKQFKICEGDKDI